MMMVNVLIVVSFALNYCLLGANSFLADWADDKCTVWMKTDGSSCRINKFFHFETFIMNYKRITSGDTICCKDGTGCFSIEKDTPFECHTELPDCMDKVMPNFLLFTPTNTKEPTSIDYFNLNDSIGGLDLSSNGNIKPFFVIIHGYGRNWPLNWMFEIKDRLLALGNNVMIVRWTNGSSDELGYFKAAANTRTIGAAVALVLRNLEVQNKISLNSTTIIGFSLGAQVSGHAGRRLTGLWRIIGLDPAGPMFHCMDRRARLDPQDARLVIVIHTHGDYFFMSGCGTLQQLGKVDFYVNGGIQQPGCERGVPEAVADMASLNFGALIDDYRNIVGPACSHNRAPTLLIELLDQMLNTSGDQCVLNAFSCASTDEWNDGLCFRCPKEGCLKLGMGLDLNSYRHGKFYLNTLGPNVMAERVCGRQILTSLQSDVVVKGRITIAVKSSHKSAPIMFQDMYDLLIANEEKRAVLVVPWSTDELKEVELLYTRNRLLFTGGPSSWLLRSLTLQDANGNIFSASTTKTVKDGVLTVIPVSMLDSGLN